MSCFISADLRQEQVSIDDLLRSVGGDVVRITSKEGTEFVLEAADGFEREAKELGQSRKFMTFLAQRSAEPGRVPLAEIEARLSGAQPAHGVSVDEAGQTDDAS
jgi:hypothetical protein